MQTRWGLTWEGERGSADLRQDVGVGRNVEAGVKWERL